jgi:caffeoyl-CoA O-methyltransferase
MDKNNASWLAAGCALGALGSLAIKTILPKPKKDHTDIYACCKTSAGRERYCQSHSTRQAEVLNQIDKDTAALPMSRMISGELNGQLLQMFVKITGAKRVLELGTYTGFTAVAMAMALGDSAANDQKSKYEVVTVDNFSIERESKAVFEKAKKNCPNGDLIRLIESTGVEALDTLAKEGASFDLVFIDADKESQIKYVDTLCGSSLLAPGGLILVDNTLWSNYVLKKPDDMDHCTRSIHEFNQHVAKNKSWHVVMLPVRDGLTMIRRK